MVNAWTPRLLAPRNEPVEDPNTFGGPYHPPWVAPRIVPKKNLDKNSTTERRATVAGEGAVIPFIYGEDKVGAKICAVQYTNNYWYVLCVWCMGEVEQIVNVYTNGKPTDGVTWYHHYGASDQTVDTNIQAVIDGYTDTLTGTYDGNAYGVCYSVAKYPVSMGFLNFEAHIKGLKTYDPRTTTTYWNDNPALALADFIQSPVYGMGAQVDWDSVDTTADFCDEVLGGSKRRTLDLAFTRRQNTDKVVDQLRTYAGCFVVYRNGYYHLIPNRPTIVSGSIVTDYSIGSDKTVAGSVRISTKDPRNAPTVVKVKYTDKTASEWQEREAVAQLSGVATGTVKRRESVVNLPGIDRYAQAYREAVERLNHATLSDLTLTWASFDETMQVEVGDAVAFSDPLGLANKPVLVTGVKQTAPGRWTFAAEEVQPGMYSDQVETEPTYSDTDLPDPFNPPTITGLTLAEEIYAKQTGIYSSRIRATWDTSGYAYLDRYEVEVYDGADQVWQGTSADAVFVTGEVEELVTYTVKVRQVSRVGAVSAWASDDKTAQGKYLPPGNVTGLKGLEVGGEVRLSWNAVADKDIWRYEVRYNSTSGGWASGTVIDRVDALRLVTKEIPAGTWDFMVKALDSVGQYSATEATKSITVTLDNAAFLASSDELDYTATGSSNNHEYNLTRIDPITRYVTDMGDTASSIFTSTPLSTNYTNEAATYHSSGTTVWLSETVDIGLSLSGNWGAEVDATAISGSYTAQLELSENDVDWDVYTDLTAKATARYVRVRVTSTTTSTQLVKTPGVTYRLDTVPREESGTDLSLASGGKTITLENAYTAVHSIVITPTYSGGTVYSRSCVVDNITVGATTTFDVYIFDSGGGQVAQDFLWTFKGV